QCAAALYYAPLQLASDRRAAALGDAWRAVAQHVLGDLADLRIGDIGQVYAEGEVTDAREESVELRRAGARDALSEPLLIALSALARARAAQEHLRADPD